MATVLKVAKSKKSAPKISRNLVVRKEAHTTAVVYVTITTVLSAALNAYANTLHAKGAVAVVLAAVLGIVIPALVLLLGAIASRLFRLGMKRLSYAAGGIGVLVLALSVVHCTESISLLTGSGYILAALLAIGIDAGMVVAEITATMTD